ncbi:hypothetical protein STCU_00529 [Strigomonas culicis]|uniref:FHA domain-containing protein n=1 Tax=Strigomonas culicis TaxID=28005 RepID=S9V0C9_9TRYP|nr:hypothetical protein STCU_05084 [Strigomonas culicis]EPY36104.1 hypothetical protein STCU_00753 [Strigomonas culicis]EPY36542.1 hypothetical protein STCU_00529 [Strigomonas culicis]|eukprot:EPY28496.1 hypothetical protein STCU_05084 [Strigomonas culicis]
MTSDSVYCLVDDDHTDPLHVGKNVVGRSAVDVEGVQFINIDSPRAAVSRMQAFIEVAPNGDAWITDCKSTNGTFLSVREGEGVRLEPNYYYQLTEGCHIVFGDVERRFVVLTKAELLKRQRDAKTPSPPRPQKVSLSPRETPPSQAQAPEARPSTGQGRNTVMTDVPYLQPVAGPSEKDRKRARSPSVEKNSQQQKPVPSQTKVSFAVEGPLRVCISGMDEKERMETAKLIKKRRGKIEDDILEANLLIVNVPAVRTPKFIIAVARGIPIVSKKGFDAPDFLEHVDRHIVSLKHDNRTYTSAVLTRVIFRANRKPALQHNSYNISALPQKVKSVADEVISGCGGTVFRRKADKGTLLTEKDLNDLYDTILSGRLFE